MAYATFGTDRNWEGYIRVYYDISQNASGNYTDVTIHDIEYKSKENRYATWTVCGDILIEGSDASTEYFEYWRESFQTYGSGWVSLGNGRSGSLRIYHDSSGNASFSVYLYSAGSYNDFNVFHPNGGTYNCEYNNGTSISVNLPRIDTSGPTITLSASADSSATVTLTASANVSCDSWAYSIDGSGTWYSTTGTSTSKTFTIPNMTGSHTFQVRARKASNGITGYSSSVTTKTPVLSWSKSSTDSSSSIVLTARYLPANTAVRIKYGNTQLDYATSGSYQDNWQLTYNSSNLKGFFTTAGLTTAQSMTVHAQIDGYSYADATFTLTAGNNMKPVVGTLTVTQDPSSQPQSFPNTWIAGISKAKVSVSVTAGSNSDVNPGAVVLTYGGSSVAMTYNSTTQKYEATTPGTLTGNTTFTVTATDYRGLSGLNSYSLTGVYSYWKPAITIDEAETFRCDANGNKLNGGPYVRVKATVSYDTGISGNAIDVLGFNILEEGSTYPPPHALTNGVQCTAVALASPRPDSVITVEVATKDLVSGYIYKTIQLSGGHRDFAMVNYYNSTSAERYTALAIGEAPITPADLFGDSIQIPATGQFMIGGYPMQSLTHMGRETTDGTTFNRDFLSVEVNTKYNSKNMEVAFHKTASDSLWSNMPSARSGVEWIGIRTVIWISGTCIMVKILELKPLSGRIWTNYYDGSSWDGWRYTA